MNGGQEGLRQIHAGQDPREGGGAAPFTPPDWFLSRKIGAKTPPRAIKVNQLFTLIKEWGAVALGSTFSTLISLLEFLN